MKGRLHVLDSMRGIAALGVVCWHYQNEFKAAPIRVLLAPFYNNGVPIVDFFFALSGFVLAKAYWTDSRRTMIIPNVMQRLARLYPLHLVMLLVVLGCQMATPDGLVIPGDPWRFNDRHNFIANLLLLQSSGLQHGLFSFNWPSWSISTEFIVNIVFLFVIALPRRVSFILVAGLGATCVNAFIHRSLYDIGPVVGWLSIMVARTGAGFFVGVLAYRLYERYLEPSSGKAFMCWNILLVSITIGLYGYFHQHKLTGQGWDLVVSIMGFPIAIVTVLMSPWAGRWMTSKLLVWLGERSYSIYMVHFSIIQVVLVLQAVFSLDVPYRSPVFFVAFIVCVTGVAAVTYRYVELPGKQLLARWAKNPVRESLPGAS